MDALRAEDPRLAELQAVVRAWAAVCPDQDVTVADLVRHTSHADELREALLAVAERHGEISTRALGYWLRQQRDRVVDGWRIISSGNASAGRVWRLVPA